MLTFYPDKQAKQPLYRQLYEFVKTMIQSGQLKTGEKMPSKRALSAHLKLSQVTIDTAYQQLVMEGYLKAKAKSGFYVEPYDHPLIGSFLKTKALIKEKTLFDYQWAFQTNVIDESFFPHALWGKLVRETLNSQKVGINQFDKQGLEELRLEIAKYLKNFRGIICRPEQIVVGSGTESLLALLIPLLGTTLHYGMENPGYPKISQFFRNWDLLLSYFNLDVHGLRVEELSK